MDSQSDMESEDNDVLPDSDDFVIKNSSEAMLDEPVFFFVVVVVKMDWKVFFNKLSPFSTWPLFCY